MPKGYATHPKTALCVVCGAEFTQAHHSHKYCTLQCKKLMGRGAWDSTSAQYARISGKWDKYFARLLTFKRRNTLTVEDMLSLLETQNYRCALSGEEMTCTLERGKRCGTNASIDRIDPKGPYSVENVQLVCSAVNKFRVDQSVEEFVSWCQKVAAHALRK